MSRWFTSDPYGQGPGLNQFLTRGQPLQRVQHSDRGRRIRHDHKLLQPSCRDQRKAPRALFPSRVCQILYASHQAFSATHSPIFFRREHLGDRGHRCAVPCKGDDAGDSAFDFMDPDEVMFNQVSSFVERSISCQGEGFLWYTAVNIDVHPEKERHSQNFAGRKEKAVLCVAWRRESVRRLQKLILAA